MPVKPLTTLDADNPTPEQFAAFNDDYLKSLSPTRRKLFSISDPFDRIASAFKLGQTEKVDLWADGGLRVPAMLALERFRDGYRVFGYIGEGIPDNAMAPPGQSLPNVADYNPAGHTGIVSLTAPAPWVDPNAGAPAAPGSLVGSPCNVMTDVMNFAGYNGPVVGVWIPAHKGIMLPEGTRYTVPTGFENAGLVFVFHIAGNLLDDTGNRQAFFLGPQPA